jgi:hypothetical protein
MGQLDGDQLANLYPTRVALSNDDFELAEQAWKLRVSGKAEDVDEFINQERSWGNLLLLKPAMIAYMRRLQVNAGGLNYVEQLLLDIYNSGLRRKMEIYQAFWKSEKIYGMGDTEIDLYLNDLAQRKLIEI